MITFLNKFKKIKYLRMHDIKDFCYIIITYIPGYIYKIKHNKIWLFSERPSEARDNGFWLYKYISLEKKNEDIEAIYVIDYKSKDYNKVSKIGKTVKHGSLKHHILFWASEFCISPHVSNGFPAPFICSQFWLHHFYPFKTVFLQHGIIMNHLEFLDISHTNFDLFIVSNDREKQFVINDLHYPADIVKNAGLCRYDGLKDISKKDYKKKILFFPTWRSWLNFRYNENPKIAKKRFIESEYYQIYKQIIESPRLNNYINEDKYEFIFFLHSELLPFVNELLKLNSKMIFASINTHDIQSLLNSSSLLITDYSSIHFDFAYLLKPILYFQFDYEQFRENHYSEGYFDYKRDGFGKVISETKDLEDAIIMYIENNFINEEGFVNKALDFFTYNDINYCQRNYEEIIKLRSTNKNANITKNEAIFTR